MSKSIKKGLLVRDPLGHDLFIENTISMVYDNIDSGTEFKENDLEWDLCNTDWILKKVQSNNSYAQHLYAALCNNEFVKKEIWDILKETKWSCSWRYAGNIISKMQKKGSYVDWYCSGIIDPTSTTATSNLPEGTVSDEIKKDLLKLGWVVILS